MKFTINSIEEFDTIYMAVPADSIPEPKKQWYANPISILYNTLKYWMRKLKDKFTYTLPPSLLQITLETYLKCCKVEKPSEMTDLIMQDLNIKYASASQKVSLFKVWHEQLQQITEKIEKAQPSVSHNPMHSAIWQQVSDSHKLPPHIWLLDSLAKRFNLSYADTYKMTMADVIIALTIDCVNAEYESRVMDLQKQQQRRK